MPSPRLLALAVLLPAIAGACSSPDAHRPLTNQDCTGPGCVLDGPPPAGGFPDGGGGSGGTAADAAVAGDAGTAEISGDVGFVTDLGLVTAAPFLGDGVVGFTRRHRVTATFSGSRYDATHVEAGKLVWADLHRTSGTQDAMDTILPVDGTQSLVDLWMVSAATMNQILGNLNTTQEIRKDRAQIVLFFVDVTSRSPLSGVGITSHDGATVAYDSGTAYSDGFTATQERGIAVVCNSVAGAFPGASTSIGYKKGSTATTVDVVAAQNATTFVTVPIQP